MSETGKLFGPWPYPENSQIEPKKDPNDLSKGKKIKKSENKNYTKWKLSIYISKLNIKTSFWHATKK